MFDEVDGEPVEQLRMEGTFALQAEVFGGAHEALAEEHLPEVVHGHSRSQGILLGGQPTGEAEARAGFAFRPGGERLGDVGPDLVAVLIPDAAHEDERVARLLALGEDHDVEFAGGALGLGELSLGTVHGLTGNLVRRMVHQEFTEEALTEFGVNRLSSRQGREFFAGAAADLVDGVAGFGGNGQAETSDVGVAQRRTLAQLDHEFVVRAEHERFGERIDGDVRLGLVEPDGRPAITRIVIEGVLHVTVVAVLLLVGHDVGDGVGHEDVPNL